MKCYRALFCLAAMYNVGFAAWSGLFPSEFFGYFGVQPPQSPIGWPITAAVVGSFAMLYAYAAWKPERGDVAVGIGLATKVLGPATWLVGVAAGTQSPQLFPLLLIGDLIWWFPFLFYLLRNHSHRRWIIALLAVGVHLVACVGLLIVARGTEANADVAARQVWIQQHPAIWTATWFAWAISSMSLLAFCWVWCQRVREVGARLFWLAGGLLLVAIGVCFDLSGEALLVARVTQQTLALDEFAQSVRGYQWLSPITANGLYCLGGLLLSAVSWQVGWLRGRVGLAGFFMWLVGIGLTVATLFELRLWMAMAGAAVMLLFLAWATLVAWKLHLAEKR